MNEAYDILQECYRALDCSQILQEKFDPFNDANYVNTARKYTSSLFIESANRLEDILKESRDRTEAILNGYLLNYVHLLKKYKARLRDNAKDLPSLHYSSYEYPKLSTFPKMIKKSVDFESMMETFVENYAEETNHKKIQSGASGIIDAFTTEYIGKPISSEDIDQVKEITRDLICGEEKDLEVNSGSLMLYVENFQKVKTIKDILRSTKDEIPSFFKSLRDLYEELLTHIHKVKGITINANKYNDIQTMRDPNKTIILARQYSNMAVMDLEYNRIFTTFARMYTYTMLTKFDIIQEKLNLQIKIITDIMTSLDLFAALPDPKNTNSKNVFIKR